MKNMVSYLLHYKPPLIGATLSPFVTVWVFRGLHCFYCCFVACAILRVVHSLFKTGFAPQDVYTMGLLRK